MGAKLVGGWARKMKLGPSSAHKYVDFNAQSMKSENYNLTSRTSRTAVALWRLGGGKRRKEAGG